MQLKIHTSSYPARRVEEETVKEQQGASQLEELRWDDFYPFSQYSWFSGKSIEMKGNIGDTPIFHFYDYGRKGNWDDWKGFGS